MTECEVCGRRLTTGERIGPVCRRKTTGLPPPLRIRLTRNPEQLPGQVELALPPMQTALTWSI